jgi:hypothetical protein
VLPARRQGVRRPESPPPPSRVRNPVRKARVAAVLKVPTLADSDAHVAAIQALIIPPVIAADVSLAVPVVIAAAECAVVSTGHILTTWMKPWYNTLLFCKCIACFMIDSGCHNVNMRSFCFATLFIACMQIFDLGAARAFERGFQICLLSSSWPH